AALAELAGRSKPETPLDLADACRVAGIAIGMAQGSILPEIAAGVANKLLEWYPTAAAGFSTRGSEGGQVDLQHVGGRDPGGQRPGRRPQLRLADAEVPD